MWEDRYNRFGGRWCLNLNKNQRANELDTYWLHMVFFQIFFVLFPFGENFSFS